MRLELHCHSTCSDGSWTPAEIASAAADFEVELFCLTDHDTLDGCEQTQALLPNARVLRGLELSCKHQRRTVHLLIWGVPAHAGAFEARLAELREVRRRRIHAICARLAELGVSLDADAILANCHGTPGRPDVAKALVAAGVCTSFREAFDRFLKDGGPAHVVVDSLSLADGLALGRSVGARMALAHPHSLGNFALVEEIYREHRALGLEGIEAYSGVVSPTRAEPWLRLARKYELVATAGSDFHGDLTPNIARPGVIVPESVAEGVQAWFEGLPSVEAAA